MSQGLRHDWTLEEVRALFALPFNDLIFQAQTVHRSHFDANTVQVSTLLSIKTGACPEDCKYCPQSGHYNTGLDKEKLLEVEKVVGEARLAREKGATRFCMGAAWRSPTEKDLPYVLEMVRQVKGLGLETCMTLGMLDEDQAAQLAECRPGLLQPQPGHLRAVLRQHHHHPHLCRSSSDPGQCTQGRYEGLLRRHHGHG